MADTTTLSFSQDYVPSKGTLRAAKSQAMQKLVNERSHRVAPVTSIGAGESVIVRSQGEEFWTCCSLSFPTIQGMYGHLARHQDLIQAEIKSQLEDIAKTSRDQAEAQAMLRQFTSRRAQKFESDPVLLSCECDTSLYKVLLFYSYQWIPDPLRLAQLHRSWSAKQDLDLKGKIKIANEGINATLVGTLKAVEEYINRVTSLEEFKPLGLSGGQNKEQPEDMASEAGAIVSDLETRRHQFFKPSPGCPHVFGPNDMSIKIVDEICPLGVRNLDIHSPPDSQDDGGSSKKDVAAPQGIKVAPSEFHRLLQQLGSDRDQAVVLDVRNYYESRIGHFPNAVLPPLRKFSSFPAFVDKHREEFMGKTILSYCTGGIRCEKATAYLTQAMAGSQHHEGQQQEQQDSAAGSSKTRILMLDGGIHNYLEWIKQEGKEKESLWLGKNYVFDARQSLGVENQEVEPGDDMMGAVSCCRGCQARTARYIKCDSAGCHLLLVACKDCAPSQQMPPPATLSLHGREYDSVRYCCKECWAMGPEQNGGVYLASVDQEGCHAVEKDLHVQGQQQPQEQAQPRPRKRGICECERIRREALMAD